MRHVAGHPADTREVGAAARQAALGWTWDSAAQIALENLHRLKEG